MTKCHIKSDVKLWTLVKAWYYYVDMVNCEIVMFLKLCNCKDTSELVNKIENFYLPDNLLLDRMC